MSEIIKILIKPAAITKIIRVAQNLTGKVLKAGTVINNITGDIYTTEIPVGLINGINATFTSAFSFIPESVVLYLNGLRIKIVDEYNTIGNNKIILSVSPGNNENILINYLKL